MAVFTVRVELLQASWEQYNVLYGHMADKGFVDTILGDDGIAYKMPPGEYSWTGTATAVQVLNAAKAAAAATGVDGKVLVTEALSRTWFLNKA